MLWVTDRIVNLFTNTYLVNNVSFLDIHNHLGENEWLIRSANQKYFSFFNNYF